MSREIIIGNPPINDDSHAGWSYGDTHLKHALQDRLGFEKITPFTHPKVADLCSGKGGVADIFVDLGWNSENITCFDKAVPKRSYVEGATWRYWDLAKLGENLRHGRPIPLEVLKYQHTFNVVTLYLGFIRNEGLLCNFLVREGGMIFGPPYEGRGITKNVVWQF